MLPCARSLFSLHARFALQWCDCISEVSGLIFGHLRHLRRWLTFGLFEIFCLEVCNHSDAQRGAMLHSFNCLTRAANRDASHALVHFVGHLWPTCWILLATYLLELYWQLTLSPAFAPSSKVTSPRQTIMTIYPSRIKTPQTFDWVCPFALHISRKQWPFCWDSSEYIWIIQNHTRSRSKFKKDDSRLSTSEKDGKGAIPVPPFQVTCDELFGQQLPWGDHQEQNRHVALAARPWEPQNSHQLTTRRSGHRWLHKFRLFALIGHGTSKDFRELQVKALRKLVIVSNDCAFDFSQVWQIVASLAGAEAAQALVLTLLLQAFQLKYSKAKKSTNDLNLLACDPAMVQQKAFAGIKNYDEQTEDLCNPVQASCQSLSVHTNGKNNGKIS